MADQSSLPSIGGSDMRLRGLRRQSRPRGGRDHLGGDGLEQPGIVEPVGRIGGLDRLPGEFFVALRVENPDGAGCAFYPVGKRKLGYGVKLGPHVWETIARRNG